MHSYNNLAFTDLYLKYRKDLIFFINRMINNIEASEDIVQECFIRFYNISLQNKITDKNIKAYLYKIAKNCSINYIIKKKNINEMPIEIFVENILLCYIEKEDDSFNNFCDAILDSKILDINLSKIFKLKFLANLSNLEISQQLGISERTIRRKVNQIYEFVRINYKINDFID